MASGTSFIAGGDNNPHNPYNDPSVLLSPAKIATWINNSVNGMLFLSIFNFLIGPFSADFDLLRTIFDFTTHLAALVANGYDGAMLDIEVGFTDAPHRDGLKAAICGASAVTFI